MALETTKASTGSKSQFWLHDGTALYQLVQVRSFKLPSPSRDRVESTSLEDDNKVYVPGDLDYGEFEVMINLRPGSTTDTLLEAAVAAADDRAFKAVLAVRNTPTRNYTGSAVVLGYEKGEINRKGVMEGTIKLAMSTALTNAAYV